MKLLLHACFGSIGFNGNLTEKGIIDNDTEYFSEILDGVEIEGVRFNVKIGKDIEIIMEGDDLSSLVTPNYNSKSSVVKQIIAKRHDAKKTSRALNMFIRKSNKILSKEPCNRNKRHPPNIILIKDIEEIV